MAFAALSEDNVQARAIKSYFEGLRLVSEGWRESFNIHNDRVAQLRLSAITGIGEPGTWDGSSDLSAAVVNDGNALNVDYVQYGLQVRIARLRLDLVPGLAAMASRKLGVAVASKYRTLAIAELQNAFSGTVDDGEALVSNSHTTRSGATRDNLITSAIDATGFMAAIQLFRDWNSYENMNYNLADLPKRLIIDPAKESSAVQALGSQYTSSQLQVNVAGSYDTNLSIESGAFTDSDDWLMVVPTESPFHFWELEAPTYKVAFDQDNECWKLNVTFAVAVDSGPQPDGIVGSNVA